ncbi:hypothetical protein ACFWDI_22970 [Streptomyces sp. NPDC060064]|uniref:hypothetical protein n=2 Tax=unclassified Streptomyces TaxID=2593676 RepID=UPI0036CB1197
MAEPVTGAKQAQQTKQRTKLVQGPGVLLVWLYGVMSVGAVSRSVYQILTDYDSAPLAHTLSAVAAVVYAFITYTLVRGGETARRAALVCCAAELAGVLIVGTWTVVEPSAFPDATVWSKYGMGYIFIPVLLPVTGMLWLRRSRTDAAQPDGQDGQDGQDG